MNKLKVSIIVPCYNEEQTIALLLQAIYDQTYPRDKIEVIVADGKSSDSTREKIKDFSHEHPELVVKIIENSKRIIPAGLNRAIEVCSGEYIVRLDAHSKPDPSYVSNAINALELGLGDNIGGVWVIQPFQHQGQRPTCIARGIAAAASQPLGVGDARYRFTSKPGEVDTVPFGAFRRDLVNRVGYFNENLLTNEDYEFNHRIRLKGGKIYLDPAIRSIYYARADYTALIQQYWRYGYWKVKMLNLFPGSIRWRQVLPPLFITFLILGSVLAIFYKPFLVLLSIQIGIYITSLVAVSFLIAVKKKDLCLIFTMPVALACMHFAWGMAFIYSLAQYFIRKFRFKSS